MERFKSVYQSKVISKLQEHFNYKNKMQLPKMVKVSLNMGVGDAVRDSKIVDKAVADMTAISGQKPIKTYAKKSNAAFKIREGMPIGCKVTLRKDKMFEFIERLILVALPRSRDFKGFTLKNMDGSGNLSFGIKEQIVFPEIDYDKVDKIRGLDITIVTSAKTNEEGKFLLENLHFPFRK